MNRVTLIGHLTANPDFREQVEGRESATLIVETLLNWPADEGGDQHKHVERSRVLVRDKKLVEFARHLRKGSQVRVKGSLLTRQWVDHQNIERYSTEVALFPFTGSLTLVDAPEPARCPNRLAPTRKREASPK